MPSSKTPLLLGALLVIALAIGFLRRSPPPTPTDPPAAGTTPPATTTAPETDAESARARLRLATRSAHAGIEPLPEIPAPNLDLLRPERESLYRELLAETNTALSEIEALLRPLQASDPGTLATAWFLANNWGILARGQATADQRVEDPAMRQQLAELHHRVLVEVGEAELKAFLGGDLSDELRAGLEAIGRKHAASASVRKSMPSETDSDRRAARRKAAAGEDPTQESP